ncbi:DNA glycosylase AlkZ-like family protein [Agromyces sp. NPDC058110]|uniref:DNA glycosylase AlkZ-like family protein n=1 Tax=Agromyces sp. NPDC058110 TaxID=3346345 RepID=UPI0036D944AD
MHYLDRATARRVAVHAQLLTAERPVELVGIVRHLTLLQVDPTAAVAPNADLVAWSRLGSTYSPADLVQAVERDRTLFEFDALVRPIEDLPLFRAEMAEWPTWPRARDWLEQNAAFRRDILNRFEDSPEPLASRDLDDTSAVPWQSTGWTGDRNVSRMLECLAMQGEIAIWGRRGRERLFTIAGRIHPSFDEPPVLTLEQATSERNGRRLTALGIARAKSTKMPLEPVDVGAAGEPAEVEGVPGEWRVDPAALDAVRAGFSGRTALLSPFDRLVYDRVKTQQLFDFEYTLEMYKPEAKRRWGYFALPILHGDRLVGKLDARADRKAGTFTVHALHEDEPFDRPTRAAVDAEIRDLAEWLQLELRLGSGGSQW